MDQSEEKDHKASLSSNSYLQSPLATTDVYFRKHNDREQSISKHHMVVSASAALFPAASAVPLADPILPQKCKSCGGSCCMINFTPQYDVSHSIPPMRSV